MGKNKTLYTKDFVPLRRARDGFFILKNGKIVKPLFVNAAHLLLMTVDDRTAVVGTFGHWLESAPVSFQVKVTSHVPEIEDFLHEAIVNMEDDEKVRAFAEDDISFVTQITKLNSIDKKFLFIFTYEPSRKTRGATLDEQIEDFKEYVETLKGDMREFGVVAEEFVNDDIQNLTYLYDILNPKTSQTVPFAERYKRVIEDVKKVEMVSGEEVSVTDNMLVAPLHMDTRFSNKLIKIDGVYQTRMAIKIDGYPANVAAGVFAQFLSLDDNVSVDFFVRRQNAAKFQATASRYLKYHRLRTNVAQENDTNLKELESSINSGQFLSDAIQEGHDVFYISIIFTVTADTVEELDVIKRDTKKQLSRYFELTDLEDLQEAAFMSCLPFNTMDKAIYEGTRQNLTDDALALMYPFITSKHMDPGGVFIAINKVDRSPVFVNNFDTKKYLNANFVIWGSSGSGKTYLTSLIAGKYASKGIPVYIIAPEKAAEFARLAKAFDGEYVDLAIDPKVNPKAKTINIFDIYPQQKPDEAIVGSDFVMKSLRAEKINAIVTFFNMVADKGLTNRQKGFLNVVLAKLYGNFGITDRNNTIFVNDEEGGKLKKMPQMQDFYELLVEELKDKDVEFAENLIYLVKPFVDGSYSSFNCQTNVDRTNKFIVFALDNLADEIRPAASFFAMEFAYDRIKEDKTERKQLLLDEFWKMLQDELTAEVVLNLAKVIRGFGGSAGFITQSSEDQNNEVGIAIVSETPIKIILKCENETKESVARTINMTREEYDNMTEWSQGDALICINKEHIPIKVLASQFQHNLITTDRRDMKKLAEEQHGKE